MDNKLWILLKVQMKATLGFHRSAERPGQKQKAQYRVRGGRGGRTLEAAPARTDTGDKKAGYVALMIVVSAFMVAIVFGFFMLMAEPLRAVGLLYLIPAIAMAAACVVSLFTTVYKTNGLLFGFRDYDMVMSLPVKTSTVITSRMMILYVMNIVFCMFIMIPSAVVYAMYAAPPAGFYPVFIVCLLLVPLVPVIIATVIGSLIAVAASHFKRKSGMSVVFTIVFMLVWIAFCMNMNTIAENFASIGTDVVRVINQIYPLTAWYTQAVCELNMLSFVLFIAVSVGAFAAFVAVVAKNFKRINSAITANRTTSNYKLQELRQSSPGKALFQKEWKRFTSSSAYLLNTGIGVILLTVVSVLMLLFGADRVMGLLGIPGMGDALATALPIGMSFCLVMTCTTACSLSLEGKSLWIVKSMPVRTKDILLAKLRLNLALVLFAVLVNSTIFVIVFRPSPLLAVLTYVTPLVYGLFVSVFGLKLNLAYPDFDWESEVKVIKQGMPTMIVVLLGMAITLVPAGLTFVFGAPVLYLATIVLAAVSIVLYRSVMTKGVRRFDSFAA